MAILSKSSKFKHFNEVADVDNESESFAVRRINVLIARILAVGVSAVGAQMLLNAWIQREFLTPWLFWPGFLMIGIGQLGLFYGAFISGNNCFWQRWYARSIGCVIATWFLAVPTGMVWPNALYPWPWWGVGLASVAAFAGLPPVRAILFFAMLEIFWFVARFFPQYGSANLALNIQDTLLTTLFAALMGSLLYITRYEASKVDEASARKIAALADKVRVDAEAREKLRLDGLVHDKVLTTLLLAAKATTAAEHHAVAGLAAAAITSLHDAKKVHSSGLVRGRNFFADLEKVSLSQDSNLVIARSEDSTVSIPDEVAHALTEATLQAILNSQQHAGVTATRELRLKGHRNGVKIVIKDDGRGFRMSRIPKNRLGIRNSILKRVELAGGRAFIDSRPGIGTNVILEWSDDA